MEKEHGLKHALVTGATSGIGYELAKLLANDNYNLILVARNRAMLEAVSQEMTAGSSGIHTHIIEADLFKDGAAQEVYNQVQELGVEVDVLINNAGQGEWGMFTNTDLDREVGIVHLNVISMLSLTKLFLKDMVVRNSGRILNLASSLAKAPSPYFAVYAASKAFVLSFSEALMQEIGDSEVTVSVLLPGATDTDFFHKAKAEVSVTYRETELYSPKDVAEAGYKGLMNGDAKIVPGFKNKTQEMLNVVMPDTAIASNMEKQLAPSQEQGQTMIGHAPSARERQSINAATGLSHGDYA
jgi:short-subunit dehydrogenase